MEYKHSCVVNAKNQYKGIVLVLLENGQIQDYNLLEGESLVDAAPPAMRPYAGAVGFISPRWDADASAWVEAATEEEIAVWEAEHPAPEKPEPTPTVEELQAKITALTTSNQMLEDCLVEMAAVVYA